MEIINQPNDRKIGERLRELLSLSGEYKFDTFYIMVAYVKKSGVLRIKKQIEEFKERGGIVKAVAGIDQKNSSFEGIKQLSEISNETYIFHNEDISSTFHPKLFMFERENIKAIIFIGSGNLTAGGLFTNYELQTEFELDLTIPDQRKKFTQLKNIFNYYSDITTGFCKEATIEQINQLYENGYISNERTLSNILREVSKTRLAKSRDKIFSSRRISPPPLEVEGVTQEQVVSTSEEEEDLVSDHFTNKGKLLWVKDNLPSSDAQQVTGSTNITGVLRLSQAGFRKNRNLIDHKVYFFNEVFNNLDWRTQVRINRQPLLVTTVRFQLKISGTFIGEFNLKISHDTNRISGQDNVPTTLHWGEAKSKIQERNVIGMKLSMFAPEENLIEPFFIEIN